MVTGREFKAWLQERAPRGVTIVDCRIMAGRSFKKTRTVVQKGAAVHVLDINKAITHMFPFHRQALLDEIGRLPSHGEGLRRMYEWTTYESIHTDSKNDWKWRDLKS
jgi:hypothetical protein